LPPGKGRKFVLHRTQVLRLPVPSLDFAPLAFAGAALAAVPGVA